MTTDVREAPASRTPRVKRNCEMPGLMRPATRNGQAACAEPALNDGEGKRHGQRDENGEEGAALGEPTASERDAYGHGGGPEEERRGERKSDGVHTPPRPALPCP